MAVLAAERRRRIEAAGLDAVVCVPLHRVRMLSGYRPRLSSGIALATRDGRVGLAVPSDELEPARGRCCGPRGLPRRHAYLLDPGRHEVGGCLDCDALALNDSGPEELSPLLSTSGSFPASAAAPEDAAPARQS